jgi:hypothetical protein
MSSLLITPSLLSSYQYYIQDEFKSPEDSRADFIRTLSREKFEPNLNMQKGLDFEYLVKKTCDWEDGGVHWASLLAQKCQKLKSLGILNYKDVVSFIDKNSDYLKCIKEIGKIVEKSLWQQSVKKEITVGNQEFLLYGRTDVIKRDTVYDIKFTSNYEAGKFVSSSQYRIYLYCSDLPKFQYLVSDGKEYWVEDYHNHAGIEDELKGMISDFMGYLENDKEAKEIFSNKWISKFK